MRTQICKTWSLVIIALLFIQCISAEDYTVTSPNGLLKIKLNVGATTTYEISYDGTSLVKPSGISMRLMGGKTLGQGGTILNTETNNIKNDIPLLYGKNASMEEYYNELTINFKEDYSLIVRAYNEGLAYRFVSRQSGQYIVESEEVNVNFEGNPTVWYAESDKEMRSWERIYTFYNSIKDISSASFCVTPTMFCLPNNMKVVVAESDQVDYPGMYLQKNGDNSMTGKWAQYPREVEKPEDWYSSHPVISRYNYLARVQGARSFPWRAFIVSADDKDLLNNELIFKLAAPQAITNTDWIKPGKSAWEWWHKAMLEGVPFPVGNDNLTLTLYKYYVDFAAENKLEFMTLDAGWEEDYIKQLCEYGARKNLKIIVWAWASLAVQDKTWLKRMKDFGVAGVKIDFFDRDDQIAMNWVKVVAEDCAKYELLLLLHGCPKPSGLHRAYPNILSYEAIRGAECNFWDKGSNPDYHVQFPFIRMLAGPLDYTPGSLRNKHVSEFVPVDKPNTIPSSMGTRAHELAMYVMFDHPLVYLCDSPTEYRKFPDITEFLSKVPSVWDKTVPLAGEVGKYAAIAKKRGTEWYIGAMTNSDARDIEIDFSFLPGTESFRAEIFRDNETTDNDATAYTRETFTVSSRSKIKFNMGREGGFVIRIEGVVSSITENRPDGGSVSVYPVNGGQQLYVESSEPSTAITIFDISGKKVLQQPTNDGQFIRQLDISSLVKGIYVAKLETRSKTYTSKFIK